MKRLALLAAFLIGGNILGAAPAAAFSDDFVTNGKIASEGNWPWQVRIMRHPFDRSGFCGGSLIAPQWVLTAAHCIVLKNRVLTTVTIGHGSVNRSELDLVDSSHIIVHPGYGSFPQADIALIRLAKPLDAAETIRLADAETDAALSAAGTKLVVTGWGAIIDENLDPEVMTLYMEGNPENMELILRSGSARFPEQLREGWIEVIDHGSCGRAYDLLKDRKLGDTELCAGLPEMGRDSCQGDSGGPLMAPVDGGFVQLGIVSWGYQCGHPAFPGVYARVAAFGDWIEKTMAANY